MRTRVKICGITRFEDALAVLRLATICRDQVRCSAQGSAPDHGEHGKSTLFCVGVFGVLTIRKQGANDER